MGSQDDTPLLRTLKRAAAALREAGVPFALGGGYAAYARGAAPPQHDVDFMVLEEDAERALHALGTVGMQVERPPEDWLVKAWDPVPIEAVKAGGAGMRGSPVDPYLPSAMTRPGAGDEPAILVDLIFRPAGRAVTPELLAEAEEIEVGAVRMPVISATHLVISKLLAFSAHGCDFAEVLPTARALREQIDWLRVWKETAESPYAYAFLVLLEQLGVITREEIHGP
jgi:Uncharacterised nucleotidyltransferase